MKRMRPMILAIGLLVAAQVAQADWTTSKRLTWTSDASRNPVAAIDSDNHIHVVWYEHALGNAAIYYRRSEDGGATWSAAQRLTWASDDSYYPAIAIDNSDTIHVLWYDDPSGNQEIYCRRSKDGGATWSVAQRLTWTSGDSYYPALAIDSNNYIHVIWQDSTPIATEIYYKQSKDGGGTWSLSKRVTWALDWYYRPALAIDSANTIHAAWQCDVSGSNEIYYKRSTDGGAAWSVTQRLTWNSGDTIEPAMAADTSNYVHVVWYDDTSGNDEIYYKRSADGGATWGGVQRLTSTTAHSRRPVIAIDSSGNIHVVWDDRKIGFPEIYYRHSTNQGASWSGVQRLTWTSRYSESPAIAIDSNDTIHVVWEDDTPGNKEIYYKNGK
jgi:hypothetical protein